MPGLMYPSAFRSEKKKSSNHVTRKAHFKHVLNDFRVGVSVTYINVLTYRSKIKCMYFFEKKNPIFYSGGSVREPVSQQFILCDLQM